MATKKETLEALPPQVEIYRELAKINVNDHVETKPNGNKPPLRYLSWPWAYDYVAERYPITYRIIEFDANGIEVAPDEHGVPFQALYNGACGYNVWTEIVLDGITKRMWLPIMDSHNYAVKATSYNVETKFAKFVVPALDAMILNKNIMRCLAKNLAMFGLGIYLYGGEDLPDMPDDVAPQTTVQAKVNRPAPAKAEQPKPAAKPVQKPAPAPTPAPVPAPEPTPADDDDFEIIDSTTGKPISKETAGMEKVADPPKEATKAPKVEKPVEKPAEKEEKPAETEAAKPMTLEEAKAYILEMPSPSMKGKPLEQIFEVMGTQKAMNRCSSIRRKPLLPRTKKQQLSCWQQ